jgi:hypothetical protein
MLQSYPTVYSGQDKALAVFADLSSALGRQPDFGGHGYFSSCFDVPLGQIRVFMNRLFCQYEEYLYSLFCYLSCACIHSGSCPVSLGIWG